MKDLLKQLVELEPQRCRQVNELSCKVLIDRRWYIVRYSMRRPRDKAYLQLAVQQAIAARGLNWSIWFDYDEQAYDEQGHTGFGGSQHSASVFTDNKRYAREGEISAAEAILSAYLEAIKEINLSPKGLPSQGGAKRLPSEVPIGPAFPKRDVRHL